MHIYSETKKQNRREEIYTFLGVFYGFVFLSLFSFRYTIYHLACILVWLYLVLVHMVRLFYMAVHQLICQMAEGVP
jgi:hypothetical protein